MQKRMVPNNMAAAKIPNCFSAGECNGISTRKAPMVVILPIMSGESTSCRVCLMVVV